MWLSDCTVRDLVQFAKFKRLLFNTFRPFSVQAYRASRALQKPDYIRGKQCFIIGAALSRAYSNLYMKYFESLIDSFRCNYNNAFCETDRSLSGIWRRI